MSLHGKRSREKNNSDVYYSEENLLIGKYIEQRKELHGTSGQLNPRGSETVQEITLRLYQFSK